MTEDIHADDTHDILINVREPDDVLNWAQNFGVSEDQIRRAVADVGESIENVRDHLGLPSSY